tara:strand:- start:3 stop:269 length:267 start_codon:yes stop_codon:yes gene_type:complete
MISRSGILKQNFVNLDYEMKENNPVEPNHYVDMKLSPLEYIMANEGAFTWCISNVIKYVSRYRNKNGIEDLKKARWYLDRQIQELEKE